jgi:hypothetical protein
MYCKYLPISGLFVALEARLDWIDTLHNDLQLLKVGLIHIQDAHSGQETTGSESGI